MPSPDPHEWVTTSTMLQRLSDFDDRGAWERLSLRFARPIQAYARQGGLKPDECEDVAQEALMAFAQAFRRGDYDRAKGRLSHWLFGIVWRRIDHVRRKPDRVGNAGHVRPADTLEWMNLEAPNTVSPEWEEVWERTMLEDCLKQIRLEFEPKTLRTFEMLVLEGRSIEDAERELATSRNALSIAKHRVSKRLRELIEQCDEVRP
jgi:DNA-directed RNA polymerase specialized sigma24 family protein